MFRSLARTARAEHAACAVTHNGATFHFQKLLLHAAQLLLDAARAPPATLPAGAVNALCFVRVLLKFASEHLAVERLLHLVAEPPTAALGGASVRSVALRARQRQKPKRRACRCRAGALPAGGVLAHFVATLLDFIAGSAVTCVTRSAPGAMCAAL